MAQGTNSGTYTTQQIRHTVSWLITDAEMTVHHTHLQADHVGFPSRAVHRELIRTTWDTESFIDMETPPTIVSFAKQQHTFILFLIFLEARRPRGRVTVSKSRP